MGNRGRTALKKRQIFKRQNLSQIQTRSRTQKVAQENKIPAKAQIKNYAKEKENTQNKEHSSKTCKKLLHKNNPKMAHEVPILDMLIAHLPTFDGRKEHNISFYLQQFDELANTTTLEEAQKVAILKAKFAGQARETLINSPELANELKYEPLKEKLKKEFQSRKSLEEIQSEFENLKQRPDQSVEEFAKVFKSKSQKYLQKAGFNDKPDAISFYDAIKLQKFLTMIRPDIALEVRKNGPKTLEDAILHAKQIEVAFNAVAKIEINNTTQSSSTANETLVNLATAQMKEIQNLTQELAKLKSSRSELTPNKENFCAICEVTNHNTAQCFYNKKNKQHENTRKKFNSSQDNNNPQKSAMMYTNTPYWQPFMPQQAAAPQSFWQYTGPPQYPNDYGRPNWQNYDYGSGNYYDKNWENRGNYSNDYRRRNYNKKYDNKRNQEQNKKEPETDNDKKN